MLLFVAVTSTSDKEAREVKPLHPVYCRHILTHYSCTVVPENVRRGLELAAYFTHYQPLPYAYRFPCATVRCNVRLPTFWESSYSVFVPPSESPVCRLFTGRGGPAITRTNDCCNLNNKKTAITRENRKGVEDIERRHVWGRYIGLTSTRHGSTPMKYAYLTTPKYMSPGPTNHSEISQFKGKVHRHFLAIARFHTNHDKLRIGVV